MKVSLNGGYPDGRTRRRGQEPAEPPQVRGISVGFSAKRLERSGVDLAGYTLAEQADDIDAARVALGNQRIDLLSESAGTRLAMIYAWRYPNSVDRSAMIGVNPLLGVAAFALQVVEVESGRRLGVGRDGDDPGGRAALEPVQDQVGEQEGGEVVDGEGALQSVGGEVPGGPEPAHVADPHIRPQVGAADRDGESAYPRLAGHVGERVHRRVAGFADIPVAAAWVRALSRPVIPMRAPSAARPAAAARPMPPVPPVTSAPSGRGSSQSLKAVPSCELPPSTLNRDFGMFFAMYQNCLCVWRQYRAFWPGLKVLRHERL